MKSPHQRLGVVALPEEDRFERIIRLAKRVFDVPIARVSFLGGASNFHTDDVLIVKDVSLDPRFQESPLVAGERGVRFYAGCPLYAPSGEKVGALCVMDRKPRVFSDRDRQALEDLSALVESELRAAGLGRSQRELRSELATTALKAAVDGMTGVWNRSAIVEIARRELTRSERSGASPCLVLVDVDYFKTINDRHGHLAGDEALTAVARRLGRAVRPYDAVGRYGGEEFLVLLPECDRQAAAAVAERIRRGVADAPIEAAGQVLPVTLSLGVAACERRSRTSLGRLIAAADQALYRAKQKGRNRVELA